MKKVLIFLIMVGVLIMGTFAIAEELPEFLCEICDLFEAEELGEYGDPIPCGGGSGAGQGGIPG
jgi:hypothetical protein